MIKMPENTSNIKIIFDFPIEAVAVIEAALAYGEWVNNQNTKTWSKMNLKEQIDFNRKLHEKIERLKTDAINLATIKSVYQKSE
jgi:predicted aldo/keto reductase-like oxidoreductase